MKNLLTKKYILLFSLFGALLFLSPVIFYEIFDCYTNDIVLCSSLYQHITMLFVSFIPTLLFSLITYKMRDEVFNHWIKFAVWAVPVMMFLTYLILGGASQGGLGVESAYGGAFDAFLFEILYGTFIGVSIYRIVKKYRALK